MIHHRTQKIRMILNISAISVRTINLQHAGLVLCMLLLLQVTLKAQEDAPIPPSPTPAALAQYGEIPVDLYHGLPSISIPLHEIKVDDIAVPISLSFHASGHKVGTVASWVGLGWSLNAGGVVARTVKGLPDEHAHGYFSTMQTVLDWEEQGILDMLMVDSEPESESMKSQMHLIQLNNWDTESDQFFFNYPGGSGKFVFDPQGDILQFPYQDLAISEISGNISNGFEIIGLSGVTYTFDRAEQSSVNYSTPTDERVFNSSWHLTDIRSKRSGKSVQFEYDYISQIVSDDFPVYSITERLVPSRSEYARSYSENSRTTYTNTHHLSRIVWEAGFIEFYASQDRADLVNGYRLDSLAIFNNGSQRIKSYEFQYRDFGLGTQPWQEHLILEYVYEVGQDGTRNPPYRIEYYNLEDLPARDSKAIDHFGYFNGALGNTSLVPSFMSLMGPTVSGADRSSRAHITGMVHRLHYPTGGHSKFQYEGHTYFPDDGIPTNIIRNGGGAAVAESCGDDGFLFTDEDGNGVMGLMCAEENEDMIEIPEEAFNLVLEVNSEFGDGVIINHGGEDVFIADVYEVTENAEILLDSYAAVLDYMADEAILEPGRTYKIKSRTNISGSRLRISISFQFTEENDPGIVKGSSAGGVRISQIDHHDGSSIARSVEYHYSQFEDSTKSSGVLLSREPFYDQHSRKLEVMEPGDEFNPAVLAYVDYRTFSAYPSGMLGAFDSDHIVYPEVIEKENGNGYSWYRYSLEPDDLVFGLQELPGDFPPTNINLKQISSGFWKRGHLIEKRVFGEDSEVMVSEKSHYSYLEMDHSKDFHYELKLDKGDAALPEDNGYVYVIGGQISGWARLDSTTVSRFESGREQKTSTIYSYQPSIPPRLILPTSISYRLDGINDHSESRAYLDNREEHVISPVTEIVRRDDSGEEIERVSNTYTGFKVKSVRTSNGFLDDYRETVFDRYNGLKPSYIMDQGGIPKVYLWGYNNTLPVAQIVNMTYSQVEQLAGPNLLAIEDMKDPEHIKPLLTALQKSLADNAQMTIYLHKEGVGLVESIDPNGISSFYEYDEFQRLRRVIDHEGYTLQEYQYQYASHGKANN